MGRRTEGQEMTWRSPPRHHPQHQSTKFPAPRFLFLAFLLPLSSPAAAAPLSLEVSAGRIANADTVSALCSESETVAVASSQASLVGRLQRRLGWEDQENASSGSNRTAAPGPVCLVRDPSGAFLCPPGALAWKYPLWCNSTGFVLYVNVSSRNLTGTIPAALAKLPSLQSIDISHNPLSGKPALNLDSLTALTLLDLSDAAVNGKLPKMLESLPTTLQHLNLSLNPEITGPMTSLTRFTAMTSLSLADTGINGDIPPSISMLQNLKSLDLSRTDLTLPAPPELSTLTKLTSLLIQGKPYYSPSPPGNSNDTLTSSASPPSAGAAAPPPSPTEQAVTDATSPPPNYAPSNKRLIGVIAVAASSVLLLVAVVLAAVCIMQRRRDRLHGPGKSAAQFSFQEVRQMTNDFTSPLLSDSSSQPKAFKGTLHPSGEAVVVERTGFRTKEELQAVVQSAAVVQHANVVRAIGYCSHDGDHYLVQEFVEMGSLEALLKTNPGLLTWTRRLRIAAGAALGLDYLHSSADTPFIHGNLTPASILVTEEFSAKLGDVGVAREQSSRRSPGYVDESVLGSGEATPKADVYSFGVVLLELATGLEVFEDGDHITRTVAKVAASSQDGAIDLMPSYLVWDEEQRSGSSMSDSPDGGRQKLLKRVFEAMLALGFMCCQPDPSKRPIMRTVAEWLEQLAGGRVKRELRLNITLISDGVESGTESGRSTPL